MAHRGRPLFGLNGPPGKGGGVVSPPPRQYLTLTITPLPVISVTTGRPRGSLTVPGITFRMKTDNKYSSKSRFSQLRIKIAPKYDDIEREHLKVCFCRSLKDISRSSVEVALFRDNIPVLPAFKNLYLRDNCMKCARILLSISVILTIFFSAQKEAYSISASVKSQYDYIYTLDHLRNIRIMIENFANEEQKKKYEEIKSLFQSASEEYYAQNFTSSHQKFFKVKDELIRLVEDLANYYVKRTKDILDSTSKSSFDIIIKYGRSGGLTTYFRKPYNPVEDIKAYKEGEFHFFFDKEVIERYLQHGYRRLQDAKNKMADSDLEIVKNKKNKTSKNLDFIINKYVNAISDCRVAKQYGIEIHKILKSNLIGDILLKHNLSNMALDPIFDDRIPEDYKVDANDNISLIHSIEKERLLKRQGVKK